MAYVKEATAGEGRRYIYPLATREFAAQPGEIKSASKLSCPKRLEFTILGKAVESHPEAKNFRTPVGLNYPIKLRLYLQNKNTATETF